MLGIAGAIALYVLWRGRGAIDDGSNVPAG